jgi:hypothetical protein
MAVGCPCLTTDVPDAPPHVDRILRSSSLCARGHPWPALLCESPGLINDGECPSWSRIEDPVLPLTTGVIGGVAQHVLHAVPITGIGTVR